jgi:hypothetical protein
MNATHLTKVSPLFPILCAALIMAGSGDSDIVDNNCSYNGTVVPSGAITVGTGICVTNSSGCRIDGNTLDFNYTAMTVATDDLAFIVRNSARGNTTSYSLGSGNSWGPIVNATAGGDISTIANSSHPDANFIY